MKGISCRLYVDKNYNHYNNTNFMPKLPITYYDGFINSQKAFFYKTFYVLVPPEAGLSFKHLIKQVIPLA